MQLLVICILVWIENLGAEFFFFFNEMLREIEMAGCLSYIQMRKVWNIS